MAIDVAAYANPERVAHAAECEDLLWNKQRLISIQLRSGQLNVRRNQIVTAELKRDLLQNAGRLNLGTAIGKAMDRISIQFSCVENVPSLHQLQVDLFHIQGSVPVINYCCVLQ